MREYYDRYMRDGKHESTTIFYIEHNPVKAGLVQSAQNWKWSSGWPGYRPLLDQWIQE